MSLELSFPAIAHKDARILILGSMPSVKSLQQQQYYAHPRNAFWPIMIALFDMNKDWSYQQRCDHLASKQIAVWDVLKACQRQGSLDQNIDFSTMVANDFNVFFQQHPCIKSIFFNGTKAEKVFKSHVLPTLKGSPKQLHRLPSTSPAHASLNVEQKLKIWKKIQSLRTKLST